MTSSVIIHPCFQECQNYTLDPYWKDIFFSCACNKFPRGVRYDSPTGTLYIRTPSVGGRTKTEAIDLPTLPEESHKVLLEVFREKLGMFSSQDLQIRQHELDEIKEERRVNMDCEWKKLKPRSIKDFMIMKFVSRMQEEHALTSKEARELFGTVQLGFQFRQLTSDDVDYSCQEIQSIRGLEYNQGRREWNVINIPKSFNKTEKTANPQKFNQSIDRFVREYRSRRLKL